MILPHDASAKILVFFCLITLIFPSLCSEQRNLDETSILKFREEISDCFGKSLKMAIKANTDLESLRSIPHEIESLFLSSEVVPENVYDRVIDFFIEQVDCLGLSYNCEHCEQLESILSYSCERCKTDFKRISSNMDLIKAAENICHLFVPQIKWLIGSSTALGAESLFGKAGILFENVRFALSNLDPDSDILTEEMILFIRRSWEIYIECNCKPSNDIEREIYADLVPIIQKKFTQIFAKLEREPFISFALEKSEKSIQIDMKGLFVTVNDDLWGFIMSKVESFREQIESQSICRIYCHSLSIVDLIIMDLSSNRHRVFSLKRVSQIIIDCFSNFSKSMLDSSSNSAEGLITVSLESNQDMLESLRKAINACMEVFLKDLKAMILVIRERLELFHPEISDDDISVMALSELSRENYAFFKI